MRLDQGSNASGYAINLYTAGEITVRAERTKKTTSNATRTLLLPVCTAIIHLLLSAMELERSLAKGQDRNKA
jgi:hypothetical protein